MLVEVCTAVPAVRPHSAGKGERETQGEDRDKEEQENFMG